MLAEGVAAVLLRCRTNSETWSRRMRLHPLLSEISLMASAKLPRVRFHSWPAVDMAPPPRMRIAISQGRSCGPACGLVCTGLASAA